MRRTLVAILVPLCAVVTAGAAFADSSERDQAIEQVKKLKGVIIEFPFSISFDSRGISDDDLACVEKLTDLEGLYLRRCKITDKGLEHVKGLTKMRYLFLSDTSVTDAGLANLKNLQKLETLNLEGTQLTDTGLAQLKGLKGLKVLEIKNTKVTDTGIADLKKAIPGLLVRN
jgi:Leucine-rich repeat (LRR) protein